MTGQDSHGHQKGAGKKETAEIDEDVLDEGSYYLSKLDLDVDAIAERFEILPSKVLKHRNRFEGKLKKGNAVETKTDLDFWRDVKHEAEGNVKVSIVSDRGFHHSWRSDLEKLDDTALFGIFESCKRFLYLDPNSRFLEYAPPKNYDPLAMQREITNAVTVITSILSQRSKEEGDKQPVTDQ
jgi:hypothetical protein